MVVATRPQALALVDQHGNVLRSANSGWRDTAHAAASRTSDEMASWNAPELTGDSALLPELATLRGRNHDAIRNNGFMSGAVQTQLDNIIGSGLRINVKPDWKFLGVKDKAAQADWERDTQTKFCNWAYDKNNYCDASRRKNFSQLIAQAYRSYLTSFDICATSEWEERPGSKYKTCIQLIDPARLSNPNGMGDSTTLRAGVKMGPLGEPIGYYFSSSLDLMPNFVSPMKTWRYVPAETAWGRKMVFHHYDEDQPGQTRGKSGIVSVLSKVKMLEKFEQATLQAAILNAMYAAVIESSLDWNSVGAAIGAETDNPITSYTAQMAEFHKNSNIRFNGLKIPHLYPGEKLEMTSPEHPSAQYNQFETSCLRYIAAGTNITYEQLSKDYSNTNYSGARAGMMEAWKFFSSRHEFIAAPFATNIYCNWLEEAIDIGEVELPAGTPDYYEAKTAWCGVKWIGPGHGHLDPEKEANAIKINYGMHLTTLEEEASAQGKDWRDILEQRAEEAEYMRSLGMDPDAVLMAALDAKPTAPGDAKPAKGEPVTPAKAKDNTTAQAIADGNERILQALASKDSKPVMVNVGAPREQPQSKALSAVQSLRAEFTETLTETVGLIRGEIRNEVERAISMPVVPVYDANGKFIGAKRVSKEEFQRIEGNNKPKGK